MAKRSSSEAVLGQKRRRMSKEQSKELEKRYPAEGTTPSTERMNLMARDLGLDLEQVNGWFQNKRAKVKTELAKKELQVQNNLFRAKIEQLEVKVHDLESQLMVVERQRDMTMNTETEWSPVGSTAAGTSSGMELVAAPAEAVAAPAYPYHHLPQGSVNEQANMFNTNDGFGQDNMFQSRFDFGAGYYHDAPPYLYIP